MRPCLTRSCTCGRRTTDTRTPRDATEAAAAYDTRGIPAELGMDSSSSVQEATRCNHSGPGGDNQWPVRTLERRTENLDGAPVDLAVLLEFRELMDKRGVNHTI
jgi:hypothetical protein